VEAESNWYNGRFSNEVLAIENNKVAGQMSLLKEVENLLS